MLVEADEQAVVAFSAESVAVGVVRRGPARSLMALERGQPARAVAALAWAVWVHRGSPWNPAVAEACRFPVGSLPAAPP